MSFIQNFFTSRDNNANAATYIGQQDRLWYNPITQTLYVSDGVTPGGIPLNLATGANITANVITVNTITSTSGTVSVTGNLAISGNISPASNVKIGGISAGPGVVISNQGQLTIDTANLPLSFGNFTASNNVLSIVNVDEDMILQTEGNAEIQLVGNIGFYKPDGIPPNVANRFAEFTNDGQVTFYVPTVDLEGAINIIGSTTATSIPPGLTGAMLHVTGQKDTDCRLYFDGNGGYVAINNRAWNGNILTGIQAIQAGDDVLRLNATAATSSGMGNIAFAQMRYTAIENQTSTAQGSNINFWTTAAGTTASTRIEVANISVANGVSATKFTTSGTISAIGNITGGNVNTTNISLTGNVIGNVITGGIISATGNITGGNILTVGQISATGNLTVSGNIGYNVSTNNATVTQLISKATAVTANGRTGQITTNNASLAKGAAVTFTVNNNYITAVTDVPVVVFQNGATADSYAVSVTRVQVGSFNITITNNGTGPLTDTIIINFAVIKVS